MSESRSLSYAEAVNEALRRALSDTPEVLVYGEDVGKPGGVFGVTKGLHRAFGDRVFDTPISESAILGSAIGAAMLGRRPVVEIMWADFVLVALDQLINQAANVRYISRGELAAPLTVRMQQGTMPGACAQHSQSLEALFTHVPGLRVCLPSNAQDAHDLLLSAIYHDDPVIVIENRNLYHQGKQDVTVGSAVVPIGGGRIRRPGQDVTLLSWGATVHAGLAAAGALEAEGIDVEVIDARWLNPFDWELLAASLEKTGRLVVAHEANSTGGFGAEVLAQAAERGLLRSAPRRVALPDARVPAAPSLLAAIVPDARRIADAVRGLVATAGVA